jgi:hypothetical protein
MICAMDLFALIHFFVCLLKLSANKMLGICIFKYKGIMMDAVGLIPGHQALKDNARHRLSSHDLASMKRITALETSSEATKAMIKPLQRRTQA